MSDHSRKMIVKNEYINTRITMFGQLYEIFFPISSINYINKILKSMMKKIKGIYSL